MLALGSVKTIITENVKNRRIQFDMHGFLAGVILADLNLAGELICWKLVGKSSPHSLLCGLLLSRVGVSSQQQRLLSSWAELCGQPAASQQPCHLI